jgi:UDP-glucose:(heptosyl)LPS alpha-1,3-glucosyltransferase
MAHGLPVVISSSRYCGVAQYVTQGIDAWVLEQPDQSSEINHAITEVMRSDALRRTLIANSTKLVDRLSWDKVTDQYEALYEQVLQIQPRIQ